jgi:hypothetical protein
MLSTWYTEATLRATASPPKPTEQRRAGQRPLIATSDDGEVDF